ncbi:MAG: energy transducer TonB [Terracidiphilus sp.]
MRRELAVALLFLLAAPLAVAQQNTPPTAPTVFYAGPGVTTPELLPIALDYPVAAGHCKELDSDTVLSAIVDAQGDTHHVFFLSPLGNDLDKIALKWVIADRFKPGLRNGESTATAVSIEVRLNACLEKKKNENGQNVFLFQLRSAPEQKVDLQKPPFKDATLTLIETPSRPGELAADSRQMGKDVTAPVVLKSVEAKYSDFARKKSINGTCLVQLFIDGHGMPQNLRVIKGLEPSLDENALYAINQYRFKPAMKNGTPVPVMITIKVDFRLY